MWGGAFNTNSVPRVKVVCAHKLREGLLTRTVFLGLSELEVVCAHKLRDMGKGTIMIKYNSRLSVLTLKRHTACYDRMLDIYGLKQAQVLSLVLEVCGFVVFKLWFIHILLIAQLPQNIALQLKQTGVNVLVTGNVEDCPKFYLVLDSLICGS